LIDVGQHTRRLGTSSASVDRIPGLALQIGKRMVLPQQVGGTI
jgi:hypothetical protein